MSYLTGAIAALEAEIKFHKSAITARQDAITHLRDVEILNRRNNKSAIITPIAPVKQERKKRRMSKAARARISEAMRKRWAAKAKK
jgi:hypothetical protein